MLSASFVASESGRLEGGAGETVPRVVRLVPIRALTGDIGRHSQPSCVPTCIGWESGEGEKIPVHEWLQLP